MFRKPAKALVMAVAVTAMLAMTTTGFAATTSKGSDAENKRRNPLETLLNDGVLDQETYDTIQAYFQTNKESHRPDQDATEKTKPSETKAARTDTLSDMLSNNVITQAEYDGIKAAMSDKKSSPDAPTGTKRPSMQETKPDGEKRPTMKNPFEELVTDGVISQSTYEAMKAYIESTRPTLDKEALKERAEKMENLKSPFTELLENGIITQEQYDAIQDAMQSMPANHQPTPPSPSL